MATKEETKRMIEVMQAFVDGEEIEYTDRDNRTPWRTSAHVDYPAWNWGSRDYRVKPKPRELFQNCYREGNSRDHHDTRVKADAACCQRTRIGVLRFVEDMEYPDRPKD